MIEADRVRLVRHFVVAALRVISVLALLWAMRDVLTHVEYAIAYADYSVAVQGMTQSPWEFVRFASVAFWLSAALALWLLGPRLAREMVRVQKERCPRCGYRADAAEACPECGLALREGSVDSADGPDPS